jgi:predicted dithiol-disulfide oxidoreductase (DUF899 family)
MPAKKAKAKQAKTKRKPPSKTLHAERFPGEGRAYRTARDKLLRAEIELRRKTEAVAALRRKLPIGGEVPQDYEFKEAGNSGGRPVKLSELFAPGRDILVVYSFMYGPNMAKACPSCTSILDSLDGSVQHITQRVGLAVVAKSPISRINEFARQRGWRNLRLVSSAGNSYNHDYHAETSQGAQMPILNVFVKREGKIRHTYATELLFAPSDKGQNPRHVDAMWPLWNVFDYTPGGRGTDWHPSLNYSG